MGWSRAVVVIGVLAAQVAVAAAADMPSSVPPPRVINLSSGWYLRGDVGYNWGTLDGAVAAPGFASPTDNKLGDGFNGGIGAGIKSKWVRTDLTLEYFSPMSYDGTVITAGDVTARISAVSAMFNGYLDLGTWYHVTPYLGVGAGASYLRAYDYSSTVAPPFSGGALNQWNFTWAVMGGFGYAVSPNLIVDLGYRYIDFGDVKTDSDTFGAMLFKNIAAHEVRAGLRWSFDDLPSEK
jgi:opacity protein-like surface antigen